MKINEIITEDIQRIDEGFWDSFAKGAGLNATANAISAYNKNKVDPTQSARFNKSQNVQDPAMQAQTVPPQTTRFEPLSPAQKALSDRINGGRNTDPDTAGAKIIAARAKAQNPAPEAQPAATELPTVPVDVKAQRAAADAAARAQQPVVVPPGGSVAPTQPTPVAPVAQPTKQEPITFGSGKTKEVIQPSDPRYAKIMGRQKAESKIQKENALLENCLFSSVALDDNTVTQTVNLVSDSKKIDSMIETRKMAINKLRRDDNDSK